MLYLRFGQLITFFLTVPGRLQATIISQFAQKHISKTFVPTHFSLVKEIKSFHIFSSLHFFSFYLFVSYWLHHYHFIHTVVFAFYSSGMRGMF